MNLIEQTFAFLTDTAHWGGDNGIAVRTLNHAVLTAVTVGAASVVALPLGVWAGRTGKGTNLMFGVTGALRALPALGMLALLTLWFGISAIPPVAVLVVIAAAPLLAATIEGIAGVDKELVDASRAQGMTESQVLLGVQLPLGMPVIFGGLRSAVLQVIATATIAAYIDGNNLGRYLIDGMAVRDYTRMLAGTVLVAALALGADALLGAILRLLTPAPLRPGFESSVVASTTRQKATITETEPASRRKEYEA